jgi:hypothetical protein
MQHALARRSIFPFALLILGATSACVDASRVDALDESVARMRAESALRDQQIGWLRWGQVVLAGEVYGHGGDRDALARKVAALETENADLSARLDRAERRDAPDTPSAAPAVATRVLDENVPYEVGGFAVPVRGRAATRRPDKRAVTLGDGQRLPGPPARPVSAHARRLDETVPYDAQASEARVFPRVLDETVPY